MLIPIVVAGAALVYWLTSKDATSSGMVGADNSGAFDSYPRGCTGEPLVRAHSVPNGGKYRLCAWQCEGTPYTHYAVAQAHLSPNWVGFRVAPNGKRKFWRGHGSASEINRMCIELGVTR